MNEDQKTLAELAAVFNCGSSVAASSHAMRVLTSAYYQDMDWYTDGGCVVVRPYAQRREIHDGLNNFYDELENEQIKNDISHAPNGQLYHAS